MVGDPLRSIITYPCIIIPISTRAMEELDEWSDQETVGIPEPTEEDMKEEIPFELWYGLSNELNWIGI